MSTQRKIPEPILSDEEFVALMLKQDPEFLRKAKYICEITKGLTVEQITAMSEIMMFMLDVSTMQMADNDIIVSVYEKFGAFGKLGPDQCEDLISTCIKIRDQTAAQREAV